MTKEKSLLPGIIVQVLVFAIISMFLSLLGIANAPVIGLFVFFVLSFSLKRLVPVNQTKGVALIKAGNIRGALEEFEKSYRFFIKYPWLDKYRSLLLLTVNRLSYTEMALLNIAYCYELMGEEGKAKQGYEEVIRQFPHNLKAKIAIKKYQNPRD